MLRYNERNEEVNDLTPVEIPIGYRRPESLQEMIARMVKTAHEQKEFAEKESFDEADDFDVDDDVNIMSPYQMTEMQEEVPRGVVEGGRGQSASEDSEKSAAGKKSVPEKEPVVEKKDRGSVEDVANATGQ